MVEARPGNHRVPVGADKAYDTANFVDRLRRAKATPDAARNTSNRRSAIDGRSTRHEGYTVSQRIRKCIDERFGFICLLMTRVNEAGCRALAHG
jgi:hypothetical protein